MKKTICILLAALLLTVSFAGCGSKESAVSPVFTASGELAALPVKGDFAPGPDWNVSVEPTHENGPWAQSYAVIDALAARAAAYDAVKPTYTFTLACHDPAESAPGEFLTAWANAVTIATEGAVDFNIGYSGAHSSTMAALEDMRNGVVDFCWTLPCYFKGYVPLANVIQNPALGIQNATAGSHAMWELYKNSEALQKEFARCGELLFVWTNCTSPLSYKGNHEIADVSEIVGNIRANNGPAQLFVSQVGASVFGCAIGDVYTNVTTGVISYLVTDWHGVKSFSLADPGVLNYYVDSNVGCSAYCLMANADIWRFIPDDIKAEIESVSGDYLLDLVDIWNYWEAAGRYVATVNGGDIFAPSPALDAQLQQAYNGVAQRWIAQQDDPDSARALYDGAKAYVDYYNAVYG